MGIKDVVQWVGTLIDLAGVAVIAGGILLSVAILGLRARRAERSRLYSDVRQSIGRSVLLGLELLVAGDIIRTVAISPTFRSLGLLAGIVIIRTFLSSTIEVEISGRWPWQKREQVTERGKRS